MSDPQIIAALLIVLSFAAGLWQTFRAILHRHHIAPGNRFSVALRRQAAVAIVKPALQTLGVAVWALVLQWGGFWS